MKRITALFLLLAMLCLAGCGRKEPGVTYPEPETLPCTLRTLALSDWDGRDMDSAGNFSAAFSFQLESTASHCKVLLYRLENGDWEDIAGGAWTELNARSGTLRVSFTDLGREGLVMLKTDSTDLEFPLTPGLSSEGNRAAGFLTSVTQARWSEQIPIAVQAVSLQDRVTAPGLDIWKEPEAYESLGYEAVYLITLTFRQAESSSL